MTNRRNLPASRWGCKPTEDVCVAHDRPLLCPHGCDLANNHQCKVRAEYRKSEPELSRPVGREKL